MIKSELLAHPVSYSILTIGIVTFLASFFIVWPDRTLERIIILSYAVFYFLWGVLTHKNKKQITKHLISEYACVSLLGALVLLMLTF